MSLLSSTQPLRRRIVASVSCRLCASVQSTVTATAAAVRQESQNTRQRYLHYLRPCSPAHTTPVQIIPPPRSLFLFRRFASTATTTTSGPSITIPDFPTHANRPPATAVGSGGDGLGKHEIVGTPPCFDALKADEEWGEDTELVEQGEARIWVTDAARKVCPAITISSLQEEKGGEGGGGYFVMDGIDGGIGKEGWKARANERANSVRLRYTPAYSSFPTCYSHSSFHSPSLSSTLIRISTVPFSVFRSHYPPTYAATNKNRLP